MFTPGPWRIQELPSREVLLKRRHWAVGQANAPARGVALAFGETEANARLIAAAPELYAALKDVLRIARAASIGVTGNAARIAKAEAALAKARGENPAASPAPATPGTSAEDR